MKTPIKNNRMTYTWIGLAIFGIWFAVKFNQSMSTAFPDPKVEYANYEAYAKAHNCNRRIEAEGYGTTMKPYMYCDNGVWGEEALNDVANHRVPKGN